MIFHYEISKFISFGYSTLEVREKRMTIHAICLNDLYYKDLYFTLQIKFFICMFSYA